jgi:hypothetical protein
MSALEYQSEDSTLNNRKDSKFAIISEQEMQLEDIKPTDSSQQYSNKNHGYKGTSTFNQSLP